MSTTEERLRAIMTEHFGASAGEIDADANIVGYRLAGKLGTVPLDSLDFVEFVMAVEEGFEIEIPDHEAEKIKTLRQAIEFVDDKLVNGK